MKDNTTPSGSWEFNEEVTASFDDMLQRSIPDYTNMRRLVNEVGHRVLSRASGKVIPDKMWGGSTAPEPRIKTVVDLGSSRGEAVAPFVEDAQEQHEASRTLRTHIVANEISKPMRDVLLERWGALPFVEVNDEDITKRFPTRMVVDLVLSVLTLQFTPINYRQQILTDVYNHLRGDGGFILVEKVLGEGAAIDKMLVDQYHNHKAENGYSYDDIDRKRASLEGVLVPVTAAWNEDLLRRTGFRHVDCFWRHHNFAAWVALK
jgi:tRNA (cmo5U34)-methyltransferase